MLSEELLLAARCQHICRWEIPRDSYPMTRAGYLKWRADLKKFHAQKAGDILRETGYDETVVRRVQDLNLKKNFPGDPETRPLENALCLVFLQFQFASLAAKTDEDKTINALRKSWAKMTETGRAEALKLEFRPARKNLAPTRAQRLIKIMPHPPPPPQNQIPLVVDLDGTLSKPICSGNRSRGCCEEIRSDFSKFVLVDARQGTPKKAARRACPD